MKTGYTILFLATQALSVLSSPSPAVPNADCGASRIMNTTQLPQGVDAGAVRQCIEHPLGNINNRALSERSLGLVERDCWYGKPVGCTDGYCWKTCGDGPWCWTAHNNGFGDWYTCSTDGDCQESYPCGQSTSDCDSCGCSC
ncbi:hypothetical protein F4819DRAFT_319232 [Hypoxylon fuscum]|nr:hypothetical protein F4819DRAFT_319232 [Hypoxylon fuscum]